MRRFHGDRRRSGMEFRRMELERDLANAARDEKGNEGDGGDVIVDGRGACRDAATVPVVGQLWGFGELWSGHNCIRLVLVSTVEAGIRHSSMRNIHASYEGGTF